MKEIFVRGTLYPHQNQAFRQGKTDGLFGNAPKAGNVHYLEGYEQGRKLRLELKEKGANIQVQHGLFSDQFNTRK